MSGSNFTRMWPVRKFTCVYAHTRNTYLHVSTYIRTCLANSIKYTSSRVYDLLIISRRYICICAYRSLARRGGRNAYGFGFDAMSCWEVIYLAYPCCFNICMDGGLFNLQNTL